MGRSSGIYPSYVKLDLDAKNPPEGWNEGARRCLNCKRAWPNLGVFSPSPCCNAHAGVAFGDGVQPDMTWASAVRDLFMFRFEKYYERWNEGATDEQLVYADHEGSYDKVAKRDGVNEIERLIRVKH